MATRFLRLPPPQNTLRFKSMREVVIASSVRTPVGRAFKGTLRATRPDELAAIAIRGALERVPRLDKQEVEDVIIGCAMPEAEQGMNVARIASLRAGLPIESSAMTINRYCASGLQAIALAAVDANSKAKRTQLEFRKDEGPRADTSLDALAKLKAAFHARGSVTAGNSSQTSDGAAAVVVMSADRAAALGIKPLARFAAFA